MDHENRSVTVIACKMLKWKCFHVIWLHQQGHRLTLLCILNCAAHLLPMPEEVETSFLKQTIKVFTKVSFIRCCILNIFRCIFVLHDCFYWLLSRLTLPQRRTSLYTRHLKQSWLPFFTSCGTKLWKWTKPDRASDGSDTRESSSSLGIIVFEASSLHQILLIMLFFEALIRLKAALPS